MCFFTPGKTDALSFGDFNRKTITIDKAVKQERGSAYNSTALQQISGSQFKTSRTVTACSGGEDCGCKETNIDLKKTAEKNSPLFSLTGVSGVKPVQASGPLVLFD